MRISVIGAGNYGSITAQLVSQADYAEQVVLLDIVEGLPQGLALDLNQSRPVIGHRTEVVGTNDYDATAGSDVVVVTAGKPRAPGMSRMDLLTDNARIVGGIAEEVARTSPGAVVIVVSNPLDEMTALFHRVSGFPVERVIGQAGVLDSSRFADKIAARAGVWPDEVDALTLGSHGDTMVPIVSRTTVRGRPLGEVLDAGTIEELVQATREGGAEIVALLQKGSAYFAPAAAAASMVRAVAQDTGEVVPACAWVTGQYGITDAFVGVPVRLGAGGVREIVEHDLTDDELAELRRAGEAVRDKQADVDDLI